MCIVIVKKLGVKFPPIENIENSCDNNPDGFAIAWATKNTLYNYRTMSRKDFLKKCKEVFKLDYKTTACVIHARIATHGTVVLENTHCWIDKPTAMSFAHNGVLSIKNRGNMTDSETFFRDIFLPIYTTYGWNQAELAINACIGTSKFAFLLANGDVRVFGNYNELKGVMYSNTSYLARTTYYGGGTGRAYVYRESFWNPIEKKTVYRTTETDAEWDAKKEDVYNKTFWDYTISEWRVRKNETDDEWFNLRVASEVEHQERVNRWNANNYGNDWD